jgi:arginine exporter protein ArgO
MPITNPAIPSLKAETGIATYITIIWQAIVIIGGLMTLIYLAWGGLDYIFSGSQPDRLKRAKDKMFNSIFGLIFLVLSYAIIKIVSVITGLNILNPDWYVFK